MNSTPSRTVPDLITVDMLAERWSMSKNSVYHYLYREQDPLPGYRLGRAWRINEGEAAAWLARQSNRNEAAA